MLRKLGHSGLETPPLVLGGNVFGWTADRAASFAVLDAFIAGGGTMIDTADIYTAFEPPNKGGESEAMIGEWLAARGRRDDVQIATKVGMLPDGANGVKISLQPSHIVTAVEESLRRLRTDYIDLYYAHIDDRNVDQAIVMEAFDRLVKAGKVRAIAASNISTERLTSALDISAANGLASYCVMQPLYNLLERNQFEGALQQLCLERGLGVLPYFGLASGFLTGKYRSQADLEGRKRASRAGRYMDARGLAVLAAIDAIVAETGAVHAQVALAWLAAQPGVIAPIASATTVPQIEELLGAMRLRLRDDQLASLDAATRMSV